MTTSESWRERAEKAEAALADARDTVTYERRANEDNCAKLLEAEAELARCRPVIEAALEYRDGVRGDYCYIPFLAVAVDAYRAGENQ